MNKWDVRFLELAKHVSTWSKDPSTKVGAVVVQDRKVVGLGFNGFPRGVFDHDERYSNRETKYKMIVHAEVNAILDAGRDAAGATLYVWPTFAIPNICSECCKFMIQSGVKELVGYQPDPNLDPGLVARWQPSIDLAKQMCEEAGIIIRAV